MTDQPHPEPDETVYLIGPEDYAYCPVCGVRLDPDFSDNETKLRVIYEDEDGPVHLGTCMDHGAFYFQLITD